MGNQSEETEGSLLTAAVAVAVFGKNIAKAAGITLYHRIAKTGDKRDLMDHLNGFMDRDLDPYSTKKEK